MAKHIFTQEEENNIKKGFYEEKLPLKTISEKYHIGLKLIKRYIEENQMERENITTQRISSSKTSFIDEVGNKYERLTVIKNLHKKDKDNRNLFLCLCDCGNYIEVSGKKLRNGNTKSCGCLKKEKALEVLKNKTKLGYTIGQDLTGQHFGKLTVIKEVNKIYKNSGKPVRQWLCKCDCGNEIIVQHTYLTTGDTQSCGCILSQGEINIEKCLKENNIIFSKEYSFSQLKSILPLRFDFAVYNNNYELKYLIEFDGEQHYNISNGYFNLENLKNDLKKNEYCLKNNIILIRIPYSEKLNINIDLLKPETTKPEYLVKKSNHYNIKELEELNDK